MSRVQQTDLFARSKRLLLAAGALFVLAFGTLPPDTGNAQSVDGTAHAHQGQRESPIMARPGPRRHERLIFYELFVGQFEAALVRSERELSLAPDKTWLPMC
jgi:hypothetical protein